jgi:uncharacterized cupredoxin-like copper-binding protein
MIRKIKAGTARHAPGLLGGIAAAACLTTFALAATVKVTLADEGADAAMQTDLGMGMPGADMSKATMKVTSEPASVQAGKVTFEVTNTSKDLVHELIVAPLKDPSNSLPYDKQNSDVDEAKAGSLGEVEERDPGMKGTVTLDLKPGKYVLFCNVPGHYMNGMWSVLTVVPKTG